MRKTFEYKPKGVCSANMIISICDDVIEHVNIVGGCPGNGLGISKLCEGMNIDVAINKLKGIDCRGRGTSCPDQLAQALIEIKENENLK